MGNGLSLRPAQQALKGQIYKQIYANTAGAAACGPGVSLAKRGFPNTTDAFSQAFIVCSDISTVADRTKKVSQFIYAGPLVEGRHSNAGVPDYVLNPTPEFCFNEYTDRGYHLEELQQPLHVDMLDLLKSLAKFRFL